MRTFRFESISLLSVKQRRARREALHQQRTVITGRNHTGKSTLIKHLFSTLGARPTGKLSGWDEDASSCVEFSINGTKFAAVCQNKFRALFDANGTLMAVAAGGVEWAGVFSEITGFNLVLADKENFSRPADARAFFLPFYINQDGSWTNEWNTFEGLRQYRNPVASILEYFSGIKPPEYYMIRAERDLALYQLNELVAEARLLEQVRTRLENLLPLNAPKTVPELFHKEIDRLSTEISKLNEQQENIRDQYVREREYMESLSLQVHLAYQALDVYARDVKYLRRGEAGALKCPTCGAEHSGDFLELLRYADDARVLRELVVRLEKERESVEKNVAETRRNLHFLDEQYKKVSIILETRRGDLKVEDVVRGMGAEVAFAAFDEELSGLTESVGRIRAEIDNFDARLKELTSRKRSSEIVKHFRGSYGAAISHLDVPVVDTGKANIKSRPSVSGSGGPRSLLAYYAALWETCFWKHGDFSVPIVVDAPQQQGQDEINLPNVIAYLARRLPENAQIVLAIEGPTQEKFDKVITLNEPYRLLRDDQFEDVRGRVEPLLDAMYKELLNRLDVAF